MTLHYFFDIFGSEGSKIKKLFVSVPFLMLLILNLSGCNAVGEKSSSLTIIYGATAVLSLLLLIGCCWLVRKNKVWLVMLFSSVLVVNVGYTFLAMSTCLTMALWANRVAYLGSVFLPLSMLMIILDVTGTKHPKWLHGALATLSILVFLIAASPGILPIYYEKVSFAVTDGVSTLVKVYGPLHPLYLVYLLGYFAAMVIFIIRAQVKKTIDTTAHAIILAIAVFVNIGVWLIEQLTSIDFEMLSVSYIISELFLLGIHLVMNEYQQLKKIVRQVESAQSYVAEDSSAPEAMLEKPVVKDPIAPENIEVFMTGLKRLTPAEKAIYDAYVARVTTKEIMVNMDIKESTLKYHSRNLYGKLGISSRKELIEIHKHIRSVQAVLGGENNKTCK